MTNNQNLAVKIADWFQVQLKKPSIVSTFTDDGICVFTKKGNDLRSSYNLLTNALMFGNEEDIFNAEYYFKIDSGLSLAYFRNQEKQELGSIRAHIAKTKYHN